MTTYPLPEPRSLDVRYLGAFQLAPPHSHRHVTVVPLLTAANGGPAYTTLAEALNARQLTVAETSEAGSVPELKVVNSADAAVLLLDGEELSGARQNRVLNTTILLPAHAEAVIPVSCTEAGRWSYSSAFFAHSGVVMSSKVRAFKSRSVSDSLARMAKYRSDQGGVWEHIAALHEQAGTSSPTSAMLDAFKAHEASLNEAMAAFHLVDGQHGLIVLVNGRVAGLDWVSRGSAYRELHLKLLKSYVFEGLIEPSKREVTASEATSLGQAFLKEIGTLAGQPFPSVGLGLDYRFKSPSVVGSALLCDDHLVHMAFFRADGDQAIPPMAGMGSRRRWRTT